MSGDERDRSRDNVVAEEGPAREGEGAFTAAVSELLESLVSGDGGVPGARRLPEPEADYVAPAVLERAAQAANALERETAVRFRAVVLDRPSPTRFRVGLVDDWNMDSRKGVARALCTTTQFIEFEPLTEGQFTRLLAHAYVGQSAHDARVIAEARETVAWNTAQGAGAATVADIQKGAVNFAAAARLAVVTRQKIIDLTNVEELTRLASQPIGSLAVYDFVRLSLHFFIVSGASDYFFEVSRKRGGTIRYLIDDVPHEKFTGIPHDICDRIARALGEMAGIDASDMKRRPLNALITVIVRRPTGQTEEVELRLASLPASPLPEITVRSQSEVISDINKLGLLKPHFAQVRSGFSMTQGMFLVTGPTGSGKTNSLHAYLEEIGGLRNRRIIEIADPIEVYSETRTQMQVSKENTWEDAFYGMLRSAPKICVVGELRNRQSIAVALEAATSGHLVFATFHTSNVETTFTRLLKAGILSEQIGDSMVCIQSQRLVRTLCSCKVVDHVQSEAHGHTLYKEKGCPRCFGIGFKGRTTLPEILLFNEVVSGWAGEGRPGKDIVADAKRMGWMMLMEDVARVKVLAGLTTFAEVDRVAKFTEAKAAEQEQQWREAEHERASREARERAEERATPKAQAAASGADSAQGDADAVAVDAEYWDVKEGADVEEEEPLEIV